MVTLRRFATTVSRMRAASLGVALIAGLLGAVAVAPPAHADGVVVLNSTFSALPARTRLAEDAIIEVPENERARVLLPDGSTREIDGPFSGLWTDLPTAPTSAGLTLTAIYDLLFGADDETRETGYRDAFVSVDGWPYAAGANATFCWAGGAPDVRRIDASTPGVGRIRALSGAVEASIQLQSGDRDLTWPVIPTNDRSYRIAVEGEGGDGADVVLRFRVLPSATFQRDESLIARLLENGCVTQARVEAERPL